MIIEEEMKSEAKDKHDMLNNSETYLESVNKNKKANNKSK